MPGPGLGGAGRQDNDAGSSPEPVVLRLLRQRANKAAEGIKVTDQGTSE